MINHQMSPMDRRPPLAVSPPRLRPRRALHSSARTPPPASKNSEISVHSSASVNSPILPVYRMISSELMALAERAKGEFGYYDDLGATLSSSNACNGSPMFERGRFYEVYSARRNERLKRKTEEVAEEMIAQDSGIAIEVTKRRNSKKVDSLRKSLLSNSSSRANRLRSSALSCSEKPAGTGKRIGTRLFRKV